MASDSPEAIRKSIKLYLIIGGGLMVLTALTVAVSYVHFGSHSMNVAVGLLIACVKASLVGAIFMHLNHEKRMIYIFLCLGGVLFLALMGLFVWSHFDIPGQSEEMIEILKFK
jgi:caa(3)-type oxidase subunit IV